MSWADILKELKPILKISAEKINEMAKLLEEYSFDPGVLMN